MEIPFDPHISAEDLKIIRQHAFDAERAGALTGAMLSLIDQKGWLQMLVPACCGGLEWPLPRVVSLLESLARADANMGWCVNLGAGANMFAGYLEKESAREIFGASGAWCAGSGAIGGEAGKCRGGYRISGRWKYASGSRHASHFTANCFLLDGQGNAIMENGKRAFRSFIFPAHEATVHATWDVTGLQATSSNDFSVSALFVPEAHSFSLLHPSDFAGGPLYRFPFAVLAVVNMACMPTGIALHFLDLFEALINRKKPLYRETVLSGDEKIQALFQSSKTDFLTARKAMLDALNRAWAPFEDGAQADEALLQHLVSCSRHAAEKARDLVHELFPVCGMDILYSGSELNKVWRDMAAAGQHYLLSPMFEWNAT